MGKVIINLQDVIDNYFGRVHDFEHAADYNLFRTIEDWCYENINRERWRFDYSHFICVCGIDIPGRIIFDSGEDVLMFKLRFNR